MFFVRTFTSKARFCLSTKSLFDRARVSVWASAPAPAGAMPNACFWKGLRMPIKSRSQWILLTMMIIIQQIKG